MSVGTAALVAGLATSAYTAYQSGKSPKRDIADEGGDTLAAQIQQAPNLYRARASQSYGDPAYARLDRGVTYENLFGQKAPAQRQVQVGTRTLDAPELSGYSLNQDALDAWRDAQGGLDAGYTGAGDYYAYGESGDQGLNLYDNLQDSLGIDEWKKLSDQQKAFYTPTMAEAGTEVPVYETRGGLPGNLEMFDQALMDMQGTMSEANTRQRQADIADIAELGPQYQEAARAANPEMYGLLDQMTQEAQGAGLSELEQGLVARGLDKLNNAGQLGEDERRMIRQDERSAYNDRGMLRGNASIVDEAFGLEGARRQREMEDLTFAGTTAAMERAANAGDRAFRGSTAGMWSATAMDPVLAVTGRQSMAVNPTMAQQAGAGANTGGTAGYFNPWSAYASNLYGQNTDLRFRADQAEAEAWGGLGAGLMSFGGSMYGG